MRHLTVIGVCVVLLTLAGEAEALLTGVYRCVGPVGNPFTMGIVHYNPNVNTQVIRRVRVFDSGGVLYFDSGAIAITVPGRGSDGRMVPVPPSEFDEVQVVVTWTQAVQAAAPIAKVETYLTNPSGDVNLTRSACP